MAVVFRLRLVDYDERRTRLIYIYIYLVFFSLSFYRTSWVLFGERETHKTCIFVFLPHPCVFLSGTRETSSVNSTTPGWFLWLRPMHRVGDTNEKGNAIDIADILFFHLLAKSLSQIFQIVDKKKKKRKCTWDSHPDLLELFVKFCSTNFISLTRTKLLLE